MVEFPGFETPPFNVVVSFEVTQDACGKCPLSMLCLQRKKLFTWPRRQVNDPADTSPIRNFSVCINCQSLVWFQDDVLYVCALLADGVWERSVHGCGGSALRNARVACVVEGTGLQSFHQDRLCTASAHATCARMYQEVAKHHGFKFFRVSHGQTNDVELTALPFGQDLDVYAYADLLCVVITDQTQYDAVAELRSLNVPLVKAKRELRDASERVQDIQRRQQWLHERLGLSSR